MVDPSFHVPLAAAVEVGKLLLLAIIGLIIVTLIPWRETPKRKPPCPPHKRPF